MSLISNLATMFASTFSNLEGGPGPELRDISNSLTKTLNNHIAQPLANKSFIATGFGSTWISSYTLSGLPTDVLRSHATYIDPLIKPILADAVALQINSVALLMNSATPPVAQASAAPITTVLSAIPGGASIATAMNSAIASAVAVPAGAGLVTIPAIVSAALSGLSGLITTQRLVSTLAADIANSLDFTLESLGLVGATRTRSTTWGTIGSQILTIPPNPILAGPMGANFWQAILLTITQTVPGVRLI